MSDFGSGFVLGLFVAGGIALGILEMFYLPLPWNVTGGFGLTCFVLATFLIIARSTSNTGRSRTDG